jgi:hypothetical protein
LHIVNRCSRHRRKGGVSKSKDSTFKVSKFKVSKFKVSKFKVSKFQESSFVYLGALGGERFRKMEPMKS